MIPNVNYYLEQWTTLPKVPEGDHLKGKNVIVTGANGGIGAEIAKHFARMSPDRLILTGRNMKSGESVIRNLKSAHPALKVEMWPLDLSKYSSVKDFSEKATRELGRIDVFVNNAALLEKLEEHPTVLTEDGHELTFQINALSPILLFLFLLPALQRSPNPKAVFTTSQVHMWAVADPLATTVKEGGSLIAYMDKRPTVAGYMSYMLDKLFLQMGIRNLIQSLPDIDIIAVNPGRCASNLDRNYPPSSWSPWALYEKAIQWIGIRSAEVGSRNIVHAVIGEYQSCEYFTSCEPYVSESPFLAQRSGMQVTRAYWEELLKEMEKVEPGCTRDLKPIYA